MKDLNPDGTLRYRPLKIGFYPNYDLGGMVAGGLIGNTYIARFNDRVNFPRYCAIKRMIYELINKENL
jgi:hypothetical protein